MKVKSSNYLTQVKPLLKKLLNCLLEKYPYVSILASDSIAKQYSVSKQGISVGEDSRLSGRGFVAKIYDGTSYAEYSFNQISDDLIQEIITKIESSLIPLSDKVKDTAEVSHYGMLLDEPIEFAESTEYEIDPEEVPDEQFIQHLTELSDAGKAYDEQILDCSCYCTYQKYSKLFLSKNRDMEQNVLWTAGMAAVMAARGEEIKNYYKGFSKLGGAELLAEMKQGIDLVASSAIELLNSTPITPGEYECICTPDVTGMIVHEAFGHGVEMDMFVKKRALAQQFIGEYVASPLVTMHDGGTAAKQVASYFFDDEGVLAKDTIIIDRGILKTGISDIQTAMQLGTQPTGNGRRESYKRKAYTRMTNTFFEAGKDKLEDMIASIKDGFLLENSTSGMEDPKNWGIQCMVNIAKEIKDGKLTGKIYSPIILTGYVPDLLKSITMVSDTIELGGCGFCGKGYKEWVKVSDGGPYIKARIRLG